MDPALKSKGQGTRSKKQSNAVLMLFQYPEKLQAPRTIHSDAKGERKLYTDRQGMKTSQCLAWSPLRFLAVYPSEVSQRY